VTWTPSAGIPILTSNDVTALAAERGVSDRDPITPSALESNAASRAAPCVGDSCSSQPTIQSSVSSHRVPFKFWESMRFPERDRGRSPFEEFSDYSGAVERGDGCWTVAEASSRGEADLDLSSRLCWAINSHLPLTCAAVDGRSSELRRLRRGFLFGSPDLNWGVRPMHTRREPLLSTGRIRMDIGA
jgi:hypothetical protein